MKNKRINHITAFFAGCLLTGLTALLFLGGKFCLDGLYSASRQNTQTALPFGNDPLQPLAVPSPPTALNNNLDPQIKDKLDQQQITIQQLNNQLDRQQIQIEDLKSQLERQRTQSDGLLMQLQEQQRLITTIAAQQANRSREESSNFQTGVLWLLVGIVLTLVFGGSILLLGAIALLGQNQRTPNRPRYPGPPIDVSWPPHMYGGYTEFLPPQNHPKRIK